MSFSPAPWALLIWPKALRSARSTKRQLLVRSIFLLIGIGFAVGIYAVARWFLGIMF